MAKRRMFSVDITDTDKFTEMKHSAQALYFHLGLHADDDGFVASPKRTAKVIGATSNDMNILIDNGYLIPMNDGLVVLAHWNAQNHIQPSKRTPTVYQEYYAQLELTEGGVYIAGQMPDNCRIIAGQMPPQLDSKDNKGSKDSKKYEEEFAEIWQLYPRKQGKKNALEIYAKARKSGITKDKILDGVKCYAEYVRQEKIEPKYIKAGSTFMSKECWNDEYNIKPALGVADDSEMLEGIL